ncbi:cysteine proteinase [Sporormia fimetaria CBS 119925]|uniref:Cysteine proteinase n=1 Tax=Sporormia fimetaria CBS 119925 TaxID=1340428 RepID=A0A6A6V2Q1_9PLEO|nr:cysteine proteinase [Sporormia fimetaria CBS 119925]
MAQMVQLDQTFNEAINRAFNDVKDAKQIYDNIIGQLIQHNTANEKKIADCYLAATQGRNALAENEKIKAEKQHIISENRGLQEEIRRLSSEGHKVFTENQKLSSENQKLRAEIQKKQTRVVSPADTQKVVAEKHRILAESRSVQQECERKLCENQQVIDGLAMAIESVRTENERLLVENQRLTGENGRYATDFSSAAEQFEKLRRENDEVGRKCTTLVQENEALKRSRTTEKGPDSPITRSRGFPQLDSPRTPTAPWSSRTLEHNQPPRSPLTGVWNAEPAISNYTGVSHHFEPPTAISPPLSARAWQHGTTGGDANHRIQPDIPQIIVTGSESPDAEIERALVTMSPLPPQGKPQSIGNLGNSCFAGSTIQCLASIISPDWLLESLGDHVLRPLEELENEDPSQAVMTPLFKSLTNLLRDVRGQYNENNVRNPADLLSRLAQKAGNESMDGRRPQDAADWLNAIVIPWLAYGNRFAAQDGSVIPSGDPHPLIDRLFKIYHTYAMGCSCGRAPTNMQQDSDWVLRLQAHSPDDPTGHASGENARYHLTDLLERIKQGSLMEDYQCSACSQRNTTTKHFTGLTNLSEIFTLQFVRGVHLHASNTQSYLRYGVSLPETFELDHYTADQSRCTYAVRGVIKHHGDDIHDGHYVAYVQSADGMWWRCSDEEIESVPNGIEGVNNAPGATYLTFCKRLPESPRVVGQSGESMRSMNRQRKTRGGAAATKNGRRDKPLPAAAATRARGVVRGKLDTGRVGKRTNRKDDRTTVRGIGNKMGISFGDLIR